MIVSKEIIERSINLPEAHPDRRIRVAYVVHTFDRGGIERSIARLASRLDRSRFEPLIVCLNRSGPAA